MKYKVIIKTSLANRPEDHELSTAFIIAEYFKCDVTFLRPMNRKTADLDINGEKWEIKSPRGSGKKTIENNLRTARKQSRYIILDLRRIKIHQTRALSRTKFFLSGPHRFKKCIIITKSANIIEIL